MFSTLTTQSKVRPRRSRTLLCLSLAFLATTAGMDALAQKPNVTVKKTKILCVTAPVHPFRGLTVTNFPASINRATVNLQGYVTGDELTADTTGTTITAKFDKTTGVLTLTGAGTPADYQKVLETVQFHPESKLAKPRKAVATVGPGLALKVGADYHYYEFVEASQISWKKAKDEAAKKTYLGTLPGYLVTITSAEEMAFIKDKIRGAGWMGASDEKVEGEWRWVTGPEAKMDSGQGMLFTSMAKKLNPAPYSNWQDEEPNDFYHPALKIREDYGHFFEDGQWNDWPDQYTKDIKGYLVEYGGTGATLDVSAEVEIAPPTVRMNAYGDVHFNTPDRLVFDYQGTGEFVALQSQDQSVRIHARQIHYEKNPAASVTTALAIWVAGDKVDLHIAPQRVFAVNDRRVDLKPGVTTLEQGGRVEISPDGRICTIYWPKEVFMTTITIHERPFLDYGVNNLSMETKFAGLLGNLNGDAKNDMELRDGTVLPTPVNLARINQFGDNWRVQQGETLFRDPPTKPTQHVAPSLDPAKVAAAKQIVAQANIKDPVARKNAEYDVALTGETEFVESAKALDDAFAKMSPEERNVLAGDEQTQAYLNQGTAAPPLKHARELLLGTWTPDWEETAVLFGKLHANAQRQPNWRAAAATDLHLHFEKREMVSYFQETEKHSAYLLTKGRKAKLFSLIEDPFEEATHTRDFEFINEHRMFYSGPEFPFPLILDRKNRN